MTSLRVRIIFTKIFEKYLAKSQANKIIFNKHLKRILEGKLRKGETTLPKKNLGRNLVFFKGRIEEGNISDRFLIILYVSKDNVIPVFIADKNSKLGRNI